MTVNGTDTYSSEETKIKDKMAVWKREDFQEMRVSSYADAVLLEFVIFKSGEEAGRARSTVPVGRNRKGILQFYMKTA